MQHQTQNQEPIQMAQPQMPAPMDPAMLKQGHNGQAYASGPSQSEMPQMVTPLNCLTDQPTWIDCPFCRSRSKTRIQKVESSMQIVVGVALCLVCVCLACLPCMLHWFESTNIFCTKCNHKVAVIPSDGPVQLVPVGPQGPIPSQFGQNGNANNAQQQPQGQPIELQQQQQQQQPPQLHNQPRGDEIHMEQPAPAYSEVTNQKN